MATEPSLSELIARWKELAGAGQHLPAEELCGDDPVLAEQLRKEINEYEALAEESGRSDATDFRSADTLDASGLAQTVFTHTLEAKATYCKLVFHDAGGLGEVYKAEDAQLRRSVAVKFIKPSALEDADRKQRFLFEAEITGQLDHPGVAPVYAFGAGSDGRPFYAMRFVRGETLESAIHRLHDDAHWQGKRAGDRRQFRLELVRHLISVANTVAYAHQRSIVNCDIKPLNIMLGRYGETVLLDWGEAVTISDGGFTHMHSEGPLPIASRDDVDSASSSSQGAGGTLAYMAPERFSDRFDSISTATDIYSLGCCLYKIIAGKDAFEAPTRQAMVQKITQGDYPRLGRLTPGVPAAVQAICDKALSLRPDARYRRALEFADDLERWLADEPVSAHRESRFERAGRWARRHKTSTNTVAILLVAVFLISTTMALFLARAWAQTSEARQRCLQLSAESAADLVRRSVEYRWRALESVAADPKLVAEIESMNSLCETGVPVRINEGPQSELQRHLLEIWREWRTSTDASSMLVLGQDGTMLARVPMENNIDKNIGRSFRFRDYFHGQGVDYDEDSTELIQELRPSSVPIASVPLNSKINNRLRIQFSAPVRDGSSKVIGILGMAVEIADFDLPAPDPERLVAMVDLRTTRINEVTRDNLVIHHPEMEGPTALMSIPDQQLLAELRNLASFADPDASTLPQVWRDNYVDPFLDHKWRAAFAPVRARRNKEEDPTPMHLVIIAQEQR